MRKKRFNTLSSEFAKPLFQGEIPPSTGLISNSVHCECTDAPFEVFDFPLGHFPEKPDLIFCGLKCSKCGHVVMEKK